MSQEKFFDFSSAAADAVDGTQGIPSIATFTHRSPNDITDMQETSTEEQQNNNNAPGYYVDTTVSSSSSNDSTDAHNVGGESVPSTPTEVIQHPPRPEEQDVLQQQQQQLSASMAFHQATAAQQAAQLAANAAALQAAQAQQAMAAASSQAATSHMQGVPNITVAQSLASMSLQHHQQTLPNHVSMSNGVGVIATPVSMQGANTVYSDGTVVMGQPGSIPVPMMMHPVHMDHSQMLQQQGKGAKGLPPTPPASADEKDHDDPEKKKTLINMIAPPNVHAPAAIPVALVQQHSGHNVTMHGTGPPHPPGMQMHMQQFAGGPYGMQNDAQHMYNPHQMHHEHHEQHDHEDHEDPDDQDDDDMSPPPGAGGIRSRNGSGNKRRSGKKPVAVEDKDDKYFERRKRNNMAAKRSRDARKQREDTIAMRANYLERENAILRAQLATLREEANSLRQLLSQRTMIGANGQSMNIMQ